MFLVFEIGINDKVFMVRLNNNSRLFSWCLLRSVWVLFLEFIEDGDLESDWFLFFDDDYVYSEEVEIKFLKKDKGGVSEKIKFIVCKVLRMEEEIMKFLKLFLE